MPMISSTGCKEVYDGQKYKEGSLKGSTLDLLRGMHASARVRARTVTVKISGRHRCENLDADHSVCCDFTGT
jgi:hypothetical protein